MAQIIGYIFLAIAQHATNFRIVLQCFTPMFTRKHQQCDKMLCFRLAATPVKYMAVRVRRLLVTNQRMPVIKAIHEFLRHHIAACQYT